MRMDNVVHKMGFADSLRQARQLVRHGHIMLNGRKTNVPSAATKAGDVIAWTAASKKSEYYKIAQASMPNKRPPEWLTVDANAMTGRIVSPPPVAQTGTFDPAVIVEYYSR
jgi:small subunit ribosomal protein S4